MISIFAPDILRRNLSQFFIFVDVRHKNLVFFQFLTHFLMIFQTKHIWMISTVQIFCCNDCTPSKNLFNDLGTQKAHNRTHFSRGREKKKA